MSTAAAHAGKVRCSDPVLHLAFELGWRQWRLAFSPGLAVRPRFRMLRARDLEGLEREIAAAKRRFRLPAEARVVSCYEAGRDGFWLHRFLEAIGVENYVVDSSSLTVDRRARRAKTDRIDVTGLLTMLVRHAVGEPGVWRVVRVPSPEAEDLRQFHRELETLKRDRTRITNRMKGLLANQGVDLSLDRAFLERLEALRLWDDLPLPDQLQRRLERDWHTVEWLTQQIRQVEAERRKATRSRRDPVLDQIRQLTLLRGIGESSAWLLVTEFFGWRQFRNRRQVGALAGLVPVPYRSGASHREQGVGKSGNRRVRHLMVELAWGWLRFQPDSALSHWYRRRWGDGSSRLRRIGIVALARKLLIELWTYLETGALPEGATTS